MFQVLQILSITLVAVGMSLSLAHALELPGKLRLERETYLAVQTIYYPGFTIGGLFGEFGATLATLVLLLFTPIGTSSFWITLIALAALLAAHGVYWVVTHPVNQVWLKGQDIHRAGATFLPSAAKETRRPYRLRNGRFCAPDGSTRMLHARFWRC
jgi:hypothetical protein